MFSYRGVPLSVAPPDLAAWIAENVRPEEIYEASLTTWPGPRNTGWPFASFPASPVRVNRLVWPRGGARWACGHFLASQAQLDAINSGSGSSFVIGDATNSVTMNLAMLAAFPLAAAPQMYLLTFVDARWALWFNPILFQVTEGTTTWSNAVSAAPVTADAIPAAYLMPSLGMQANYEPAGSFLDALAYSTGMHVVARFDGTLTLQRPATAASIVATNLATLPLRSLAGGPIQFSVPAGAATFFPRQVDGVVDGSYYQSTTGGQIVHAAALLNIASGSPTNQTEIDALGAQISADVGAWTNPATALRQSFHGAIAWQPEGFHDIIWEHNDGNIVTRVEHLPLVERFDTIAVASTAGSSSSATTPPQFIRIIKRDHLASNKLPHYYYVNLDAQPVVGDAPPQLVPRQGTWNQGPIYNLGGNYRVAVDGTVDVELKTDAAGNKCFFFPPEPIYYGARQAEGPAGVYSLVECYRTEDPHWGNVPAGVRLPFPAPGLTILARAANGQINLPCGITAGINDTDGTRFPYVSQFSRGRCSGYAHVEVTKTSVTAGGNITDTYTLLLVNAFGGTFGVDVLLLGTPYHVDLKWNDDGAAANAEVIAQLGSLVFSFSGTAGNLTAQFTYPVADAGQYNLTVNPANLANDQEWFLWTEQDTHHVLVTSLAPSGTKYPGVLLSRSSGILASTTIPVLVDMLGQTPDLVTPKLARTYGDDGTGIPTFVTDPVSQNITVKKITTEDITIIDSPSYTGTVDVPVVQQVCLYTFEEDTPLNTGSITGSYTNFFDENITLPQPTLVNVWVFPNITDAGSGSDAIFIQLVVDGVPNVLVQNWYPATGTAKSNGVVYEWTLALSGGPHEIAVQFKVTGTASLDGGHVLIQAEPAILEEVRTLHLSPDVVGDKQYCVSPDDCCQDQNPPPPQPCCPDNPNLPKAFSGQMWMNDCYSVVGPADPTLGPSAAVDADHYTMRPVSATFRWYSTYAAGIGVFTDGLPALSTDHGGGYWAEFKWPTCGGYFVVYLYCDPGDNTWKFDLFGTVGAPYPVLSTFPCFFALSGAGFAPSDQYMPGNPVGQIQSVDTAGWVDPLDCGNLTGLYFMDLTAQLKGGSDVCVSQCAGRYDAGSGLVREGIFGLWLRFGNAPLPAVCMAANGMPPIPIPAPIPDPPPPPVAPIDIINGCCPNGIADTLTLRIALALVSGPGSNAIFNGPVTLTYDAPLGPTLVGKLLQQGAWSGSVVLDCGESMDVAISCGGTDPSKMRLFLGFNATFLTTAGGANWIAIDASGATCTPAFSANYADNGSLALVAGYSGRCWTMTPTGVALKLTAIAGED